MNNATFEIYSQEVENSIEVVYYSDTMGFNLKKYENGNLVFDGMVTLVDIYRGRTGIPLSDYDGIRQELYMYIDNHNENLASHSADVRFEILDMDSRYAYRYKEYMNGNLVREGTAWAKDFENDIERDAWDEAVLQYRNNNGITTSTDEMRSGMESVNNAISVMDSQYPLEIDLTPPLIETAIPTLVTDPCNFVENIMKAVKTAISRINGLPNPVELANYYINVATSNISTVSTAVANAQRPATELSFSPVEENFDEVYDYFKELDAEREEYLKEHPYEYYTFNLVDYEPPVLATVMQYTGGGGASISGGNKSEVLATLGFTGTDSKEYCASKMRTVKVQTISGERNITVHESLASEVQSIFTDIYNIGFNVKQTGGYCYRTINNPHYPNSTKLSMHSFGCAIDINWSENPFSSSQKKPFEYAPATWNGRTYDQNTCIWTNDHPVVKIFRNYEWGWGGRYGDFMHFSKANGS